MSIVLTTLDAIILGIIQGLTEFLPVSSSGHLKLVQYLLGLENLDRYVIFDLACHMGTLVAIFIVFFRSIKDMFFVDKRLFWQVVMGTLPLFPLVLLLKRIKAVYADPGYLGYFFLLTAGILFLGVYFGKNPINDDQKKRPWRDAFSIGLWQALAILPGVSRSGSTISGARLLGWSGEKAVRFSFLLAIPAILGATTLELFAIWKRPELGLNLPLSHYFLGFMISFVVGLGALHLLLRLVLRNKFSYFAWYCLFLGIVTIIYFHTVSIVL